MSVQGHDEAVRFVADHPDLFLDRVFDDFMGYEARLHEAEAEIARLRGAAQKFCDTYFDVRFRANSFQVIAAARRLKAALDGKPASPLGIKVRKDASVPPNVVRFVSEGDVVEMKVDLAYEGGGDAIDTTPK
jgi:hypothetical protein